MAGLIEEDRISPSVFIKANKQWSLGKGSCFIQHRNKTDHLNTCDPFIFLFQTLFHTLPSMTGLIREDWISPSVFTKANKQWSLDKGSCFIQLHNKTNHLNTCDPFIFLFRPCSIHYLVWQDCSIHPRPSVSVKVNKQWSLGKGSFTTRETT